MRSTANFLKRLAASFSPAGERAGLPPAVIADRAEFAPVAKGKRILEEHLEGPIRYSGFDYSAPLVARAREVDPSLDIVEGNVLEFDGDDRLALPEKLARVPDLELVLGLALRDRDHEHQVPCVRGQPDCLDSGGGRVWPLCWIRQVEVLERDSGQRPTSG